MPAPRDDENEPRKAEGEEEEVDMPRGTARFVCQVCSYAWSAEIEEEALDAPACPICGSGDTDRG